MGGMQPLKLVTDWRSEEQYQRVKEQRRGHDDANRTGWRHDRPGHVPLWEEALTVVHGLKWRESLQTKEGKLLWDACERDFARTWREIKGVAGAAPAGSFGPCATETAGEQAGADDTPEVSSGPCATETAGVPKWQKKAPKPRPWHLLDFEVPRPGSFHISWITRRRPEFFQAGRYNGHLCSRRP